MKWKKISDAVVRRLPLYLRVLNEVSQNSDFQLLSSHELGERAGVSPALVRKDLAWFGEFGKQGVGYEVPYLRDELRKILNLDQVIKIALVGVGSLGHALARYNQKRYTEDKHFNLHIIALFDGAPSMHGEKIGSLEVLPMEALPAKVRELDIQMALITVPAEAAQQVAETCAKAGIKAILNFAPAKITVPDEVHVANADVSLEMQRLAYYLEE
ncbi:MAG: redox-sensing transcriptional repressor Rex [Firmicutes bacterium]|nr:redox-sensing transcriptional repressor Rex [Bacillota bacterium]